VLYRCWPVLGLGCLPAICGKARLPSSNTSGRKNTDNAGFNTYPYRTVVPRLLDAIACRRRRMKSSLAGGPSSSLKIGLNASAQT